MATRVLLKAFVGRPDIVEQLGDQHAVLALGSSATLPGVAEVRISALSGEEIGARPCEKERKRRS